MRGGGGQAGDALPFLAFTLREMYDLLVQEDRSTFTQSDYERVGRIEGAIKRRAEAAESLLPADSGPVLGRLLPRFVTLSEDRLPASRPVPRERLTAEEQPIVETLENQRLLTGAGGTVRLTHEKLITAWPRLAQTVAGRRDDLLLQARLERQAADWENGNGELLGRDAAAAAFTWLAERADPGTDRGVIGDYLRASRRALSRRRARLAGALATIMALALAASAIAVIAGIQRSDAVSQSHIAQSEEMGAEALDLFSTNAPLAMLLSVAAFERDPTRQATEAMAATASEPLEDTLVEAGHSLRIAFSPDGDTLVVGSIDGSADGTVDIWNTSVGRQTMTLTRTLTVDSPVYSVAFNPRGDTFAVGEEDGTVGLWNAATGRQTGTLTTDGPSDTLAFNPSGGTLAAGGADGIVGLWNTATGRQTATLTAASTTSSQVNSVVFSPGGQTLAVGLGSDVSLWNTATDQRTATLTGTSTINSVAFSPGGGTLAAGGEDGAVGLWNTATDQRTATLTGTSAVNSVAFSPGGGVLAAGGDDGIVGLWNTVTDQQTASLPEGSTPVNAAAFSPGGGTLAIADDAGVGLGTRATGTLTGDSSVSSVAYGPGGRTLAVGYGDGRVALWDTANDRVTATLPTGSTPQSIAFSPDGRTLAVGGQNGAVALWNIATEKTTATLPVSENPDYPINSVAFNPSGSTLAVASDNHTASLWIPLLISRPSPCP